MPKFLKLLPIDKNPLSKVGKLIQDAAAGIDEMAQDLDQTLKRFDEPKEEEKPEAAAEVTPEAAEALDSVTNQATLAWQLDHLIDDLLHLEVDHLPAQGQIAGKACDCIAKGAREARRHAMETIPIAARQGAEAQIYMDMAKWANHLIDIGGLDAVNSGKFNDEYLVQSGTASNFRKELEKRLSGLKQTHRQHCENCPSVLDMRQFIDRRRKEGIA